MALRAARRDWCHDDEVFALLGDCIAAVDRAAAVAHRHRLDILPRKNARR